MPLCTKGRINSDYATLNQAQLQRRDGTTLHLYSSLLSLLLRLTSHVEASESEIARRTKEVTNLPARLHHNCSAAFPHITPPRHPRNSLPPTHLIATNEVRWDAFLRGRPHTMTTSSPQPSPPAPHHHRFLRRDVCLRAPLPTPHHQTLATTTPHPHLSGLHHTHHT